MDLGSQVIRLCAAGLEAETIQCFDEAARLFEQAWYRSRDHYEACIAAHYVARQQRTRLDILRWNRIALARAVEAADDDARVIPFFALFHLNVAKAHEDLAEYEPARHHYTRASQYLTSVTSGSFRVLIEFRINRGIERCDRYFSDLS